MKNIIFLFVVFVLSGCATNQFHLVDSNNHDLNDIAYLQNMATQGDAEAQYQLGYAYIKGRDVSKDYIRAAELLRKSSQNNHTDAMVVLGMMYLTGDGVDKDYLEAFGLFENSSNKGNAKAMDLMGHMYYEGYGVTKNYSKAKEYFMRACNHGWQDSCGKIVELNKLSL